MIALPVHIDSDASAYWIVDARGRVVADCITKKEDAEAIRDALNNGKENEPDF